MSSLLVTTVSIPYLQVIAIMIWHTMPGTLGMSSFESTPAHIGGVLMACVSDQISLTCSHDNDDRGVTRWIFSPPVDCSETINHNDPISAQPCGPFTFQDVTEKTQDTILFNSTAVATANASMNGAIVECRDGSGSAFNQIGNVSLCIIDQPRNLTVIKGALILWSGSACGGAVTYRVVVTPGNDTEFVGNVTTTADNITVADIPNLQPNQEYTVSVTTVGNSCTSEPATMNFRTQSYGSMTTPSKHLVMMHGSTLAGRINIMIIISFLATSLSTTTSTTSTGQSGPEQPTKSQDRMTAIGVCVCVFVVLFVAVCIVAGIVVIIVVIKYRRHSKSNGMLFYIMELESYDNYLRSRSTK